MPGIRHVAEVGSYWNELQLERSPKEKNGRSRPDRARETSKPLHPQLRRTIEGEIIPRLLLAHRHADYSPSVSHERKMFPNGIDVEEFTRIAMTHELGVVASFVEAMRYRGVQLEALFLDLLAPSARLMGELWEADLADFAEVTLGLSHLQRILRDLSPAFVAEGDNREIGRRALLVAAPGDQHTFGISMVEEFFRRAGWEVFGAPSATAKDLLEMVRRDWFAVVGFSLSSEIRLEGLANVIQAIRRASRNRNVGIMVGGNLFLSNPELVLAIGADLTAVDGRQAVLQAQNLLALRLQRT